MSDATHVTATATARKSLAQSREALARPGRRRLLGEYWFKGFSVS